MAEFDAAYQAARVDSVPTLVVHDRGDRQTPWADSARLVESLPDARLVTTEGLGHRRILQDVAVVRQVDGLPGRRRVTSRRVSRGRVAQGATVAAHR